MIHVNNIGSVETPFLEIGFYLHENINTHKEPGAAQYLHIDSRQNFLCRPQPTRRPYFNSPVFIIQVTLIHQCELCIATLSALADSNPLLLVYSYVRFLLLTMTP
jgi:hypothetical protein